ncbi:hypothetical protein PDK93_27825 [Bacillus cereus]|uniref:hypothetical protein n=1 Tax=Bacillus cereus group TaxID=86661 RepID=UPI001E299634|nr:MULTISPECIES: hypothetical protein [Bacillus cereus group]MCC2392142.1 hypothetical protein [Bacillus pacificus]MCU5452331.1 hypothetical protein [Bacillus cereus]MDA1569832.1 hypothetical protein [Bacillus cereus]MDA1620625.1 hypothetical protein [Bacillus cereus group sp. TH204-1LC]
MKERYSVIQKYMVAGVEEKEKVSLYTLIEIPAVKKRMVVCIGNKVENLVVGQTYEVELEISIETKRFDTKDGMKYVDVASKFVRDIR